MLRWKVKIKRLETIHMFNFTVLAIILLLVVIAYLAIFVMQRTTVKKVSDLRARKDQLESLKVREELVEGRKLP